MHVKPTYRRMCKFSIFEHLLTLFAINKYYTSSYIILVSLHETEHLSHKARIHTYFRKLILPGKPTIANARFISLTITCFSIIEFAVWLNIILLCSGDVHPNTGPSSFSSSDSVLSA